MKNLIAHARPALLTSAFLFSPIAYGAIDYTGLNFSNWVDEGGATLTALSLVFEKATTMKFTNVATVNGIAVDATITASAITGNGTWGGWKGNYYPSTAAGQPRGDIALLYYGVSGTNSFNYSLKFYVGGTSFTQAKSLDAFRLMMYDVDGEASQDEFATAYKADGLTGYQRGNLMQSSETSDAVRFTGPGANQDEKDTDGAFVLYYANTDTVNIRMENNTKSGGSNPVFSALDGDMSMLPAMAGTFTQVTAVPGPGAAALIGLAGALCGRRRRA